MKNLEGDRRASATAARTRRPINFRALGRVAAGLAAVGLVGVAAAGAYRSGWSPSALTMLPRLAAAPPAPRTESPAPRIATVARTIPVAATPAPTWGSAAIVSTRPRRPRTPRRACWRGRCGYGA